MKGLWNNSGVAAGAAGAVEFAAWMHAAVAAAPRSPEAAADVETEEELCPPHEEVLTPVNHLSLAGNAAAVAEAADQREMRRRMRRSEDTNLAGARNPWMADHEGNSWKREIKLCAVAVPPSKLLLL